MRDLSMYSTVGQFNIYTLFYPATEYYEAYYGTDIIYCANGERKDMTSWDIADKAATFQEAVSQHAEICAELA